MAVSQAQSRRRNTQVTGSTELTVAAEYLSGGKGTGLYAMFLHKNRVHAPRSAAQRTNTLECTSSTVAPEPRTEAGKGQAPKYQGK